MSALQILTALRALHEQDAAQGALWAGNFQYDDTGRLCIVSCAGVLVACQGNVGSNSWNVTNDRSTQPDQDNHGDQEAPASFPTTPPPCMRLDGPNPKLWYRAPEEQVRSFAECESASVGDAHAFSSLSLLPAQSCASSADVWVAGCLLAEMANGGVPIFQCAETEFDLLAAHCDMLGFEYVSEEIQIGSFRKLQGGYDGDEAQTLRTMVSGLCDCGMDLLSKLLCCNWRERITVQQALEHPFFSSCSCSFTPSILSSNILQNSSCSSPCPDDCCHDEDVYDSFFERISAASDACGGRAGLPLGLFLLVEEQRSMKRSREPKPEPEQGAAVKSRCRVHAPRDLLEVCSPLVTE